MIVDLYRFVRFSAWGATGVLPLLGAASVDPPADRQRALVLLGVAATFHVFAYVHNDVVDLELDRRQPLRANYPLVRGAIAPRTALTIALIQPVLALVIDSLQPPGNGNRSQRLLRLAGAFVGLAGYNLWGKRCHWPILTDLLQGVGWGCLIGYGAWSQARPTRLTHYLYAYELGLIALVNGIHGSLRDLDGDLEGGAHTTAIRLGAYRTPGGDLRIPTALAAYALGLQALLLIISAMALADQSAFRDTRRWYQALGTSLAVWAALLALPFARNRLQVHDLGMLHLILVLSLPLVIIGPRSDGQVQTIMVATHVLPLLANGMTYDALRHLLYGSNG